MNWHIDEVKIVPILNPSPNPEDERPHSSNSNENATPL